MREVRDFAGKMLTEGLGHVVSVATGAVALLVTFQEKLGANSALLKVLLATSWVCFGIAVAAAIVCKLFAWAGLTRAMEVGGDDVG